MAKRARSASKPSETTEARATVETSSPAFETTEELNVFALTRDGLTRLHDELCSKQPPQCNRTYQVADFRAHVINLYHAKQHQEKKAS